MQKADISIVFPALNEKHRILDTLKAYTQFFGEKADYVVVNNGSTDGTAVAIQEQFGTNPRVKVLNYKDALGKGGAVYAGFRATETELLGFTDADGSTPPAEFSKIIDALKQVDIAVGSRWIEGSQVTVEQDSVRRTVGRIFNWYVNALFNLQIEDTQCGAKALKRTVFDSVQGLLHIKGFSFDVELLVLAKEFGFKTAEIPIQWQDKPGSKFDPINAGLQAAKEVTRLRFRLNAYRNIQGKTF